MVKFSESEIILAHNLSNHNWAIFGFPASNVILS